MFRITNLLFQRKMVTDKVGHFIRENSNYFLIFLKFLSEESIQ